MSGPIFAKFLGQVHDQPNFLFAIAQGTLLCNRFWRQLAKISYTIFILCVGIPQRMAGSQHGCTY